MKDVLTRPGLSLRPRIPPQTFLLPPTTIHPQRIGLETRNSTTARLTLTSARPTATHPSMTRPPSYPLHLIPSLSPPFPLRLSKQPLFIPYGIQQKSTLLVTGYVHIIMNVNMSYKSNELSGHGHQIFDEMYCFPYTTNLIKVAPFCERCSDATKRDDILKQKYASE